MNDKQKRLRELPSVDLVLKELGDLVDQWGHERVTSAVRTELGFTRERITNGDNDKEQSSVSRISKAVAESLLASAENSLVTVFNLSGTVLHTNLGRALLPDSAVAAVSRVARSASNLEYDLQEGKRGDRDSHIEELLCEICGAEAATVVNNNAAAVLLTLNTLAKDRQVPVSRGELVEIGGSFRMPEIIRSAGCKLVEIGTTNRTHLKDYATAINDDTAILLKVHTSNYRIEGFTSEVTEHELAHLAHAHDIAFVIDLGSGNLVDFSALGLPDEPTVGQALNEGADLVTFSGDKLLGGPQCGIIAGRKDLITQIKSNPLKRALRIDKMTLAALVEVLRLYQNPEQLRNRLPTLALLTRPLDEIRAQAERLLADVTRLLPPQYTVTTIECMSQVGSGALPMANIPSHGLSIRARDNSDQALRELAAAMRALSTPVIGRIHNGEFILDLRCLEDEKQFLAQLVELADQLS